jgi:hypothetical protein
MGLSIHYSGRIKDAALIPSLIEEVKDICSILQWNYHLYNDENVKGISFSPAKCEPVFLTFSGDNELYSPALLQYNISPATTISVKTQFAGVEAHKAVIKLFKYLKETYFSEFELSDEGGYWDNLDEEKLNQQFNRYNYILNKVTGHLKEFKANENDTAESLVGQLEKYLNERLSSPE